MSGPPVGPRGRHRLLASFAALLPLSGCEPPAPTPFAVTLMSSTTQGGGVQGTRLWVGGLSLGTTGQDGSLSASLLGQPGESQVIAVTCPAGYHTERPERRLVLGRATGTSASPAPMTVRVLCKPHEQELALVVRSAAGLPVLVDGQQVGQTSPDGLEHVLLRMAPGSTLQIQLDTARHPQLEPHRPIKTFQIPDHDELLIWDQPLHKPEAPARRRRRSRPPDPVVPVHRPRRIGR